MNLSRMTDPEMQSRFRVVSEAKADSEAEASLLTLWLFYGISDEFITGSRRMAP